jgi:hypothetical protein
MAREVFGPGMFREEGKTIEQLDKKRKKETKSGTADWWEEEKQEQEDLERLHEEAAAKYEGTLNAPPPEDWTTEEIVKALDEEAEKERSKRSEIAKRDVSGLKGPYYGPHKFSEIQGVVERKVLQRGQRSGRKPRRHGREETRKEVRKEAA